MTVYTIETRNMIIESNKEIPHHRLKGVTKAGMEYSIKEFDGDVISLYKQMCDKGHKFILNPEGSVSF